MRENNTVTLYWIFLHFQIIRNNQRLKLNDGNNNNNKAAHFIRIKENTVFKLYF